ncbi:anti-sigma factor antagonist [Floridanema evergladense]|uniref:Anti-sigma factor antagonist n=1 Tax=Floridaenema evergladense BLCC-F167 TaxID=3153639 RepID=A0ABV4WQM6_9CYAN
MTFSAILEIEEPTATITLEGALDASTAPIFKAEVEKAIATENVKNLVLEMEKLEYMASAGLRVLLFATQKKGKDIDKIYVVNPQEGVLETLEKTGVIQSLEVVDDLKEIEKV